MGTSKPPEKILMVDDEANLLSSFRRELRGKINLDTALGGEEALAKIRDSGPYAIVVSDYKMPGMNGVQLLAKVRRDCPDTVRIMLSGYADMEGTIQAVNEGNIFRFLTKPCGAETLLNALVDGIRQFRLLRSERELLDQTLRGSINMLTDLLSLLKPQAFSKATRIANFIREIVSYEAMENGWELETAAMLSHIGCITLPDYLVGKATRGEPLDKREQEIYYQHPSMGAEMISAIPRMEEVSRIIAYQEKHFDGSGFPEDETKKADIPIGARLLKAVTDFDTLIQMGHSKGKALDSLVKEKGCYDPDVLQVIGDVLGFEATFDIVEVHVYGLENNMVLAEDVFAVDGEKRLLTKGALLSQTLIMSLRSYHRIMGVKEPIKIAMPLK